ncbi:nuclear protein localization protein 4 [Tilletia horrida]|uniref:Nuclear protein localization protein 4 n=1 Tax=Tilletia horrida TaxID=155126 RepID=A0AAN6GIA6_9BASI|nr:nuclear protein localization protein 4 [Tilletia horrida]
MSVEGSDYQQHQQQQQQRVVQAVARLVRVRSKDGIFRFDLQASDDAGLLITKTLETTDNADPASLTFSNQPRGGEFPAETLRGKTLGELGIAHGHLLYAGYKQREGAANGSQAPADSQPSSSAAAAPAKAAPADKGKKSNAWETIKEDAVDVILEKQDGKILRPKDAKFCRHGDKAMCDYCMPLEPYDAAYHAEHKIKHLSFHAYLRQKDVLTNSNSKGSSYIPPLDPVSYQVLSPCPSGTHPSWPAGICSKCQPSAITLLRQNYRMVDHVEFASASLIENLLGFWRKTGQQRFGFLVGRYEPYTVTNEATTVAAGGAGSTGKKIAGVPLGIKAVVEAIHEPPQEGEIDGLTIGTPWEDQARIEALAQKCVSQAEGFAKGLGCQFLGMIYTDLTPADPTFEDKSLVGKVLPKRHKDSYFLSGNEVVFAAHVQLANMSPSRFSRTGQFNSKFVTCVLSGTAPEAADPADEEAGGLDQIEWGAIDVRAYQVSEQAMALVQADLIEASVKPNVMRLKQSADKERYVPEVFYRYKNQYSIEVKESAKPTFPVEYLLVNVTHGFPNNPSPLFLSSDFPIENRPGLHDQSSEKALALVSSALQGAELHPLAQTGDADAKGKGRAVDDGTMEVRKRLVRALSDWHLFAFLDTSPLLEPGDIDVLANVVASHDPGAALDALLQRPGWQTLVALSKEQGGPGGGAGGGFGGINEDEDADLAAAIRASMAGVSDVPDSSPPRSAPPAPAVAPAAPPSPPIRTVPSASAAQVVEDDPYTFDGAADDYDFDDEDDDVFHDQDDEDEDEDMATSRRLTRDDSDVQISAVRRAATAAASSLTAAAGTGAGARAEDAILIDDEDEVFASAPSSTVHGTHEAAAAAAAAGGGSEAGVKVCPHCTYHNDPGAGDCDVCGLPI